MRKVRETEINGRRLTLNELTVAEIYNRLERLGSSLLDVMFDGRLPLDLVCASAGIEENELEVWPPSEIEKLIGEVEKANPHCARLCRNLAAAGEKALAPTATGKDCAGPAGP